MQFLSMALQGDPHRGFHPGGRTRAEKPWQTSRRLQFEPAFDLGQLQKLLLVPLASAESVRLELIDNPLSRGPRRHTRLRF